MAGNGKRGNDVATTARERERERDREREGGKERERDEETRERERERALVVKLTGEDELRKTDGEYI